MAGEVDGSTAGSTRDRILRRGVEMLEQGGEAAVRVNDIATDCEVSITSLYHFFGSRDGLIEAVQAARYADYSTRDVDDFAAAAAHCRSSEDFKTLVINTLNILFADPQRAQLRHLRVEILGSAAHRPALALQLGKSQMGYNKRMGQVLHSAQAQGWLRPDIDVEVVASFFLGIMNARVVIEVGDQDIDEDAWNAMAISFVTSQILA